MSKPFNALKIGTEFWLGGIRYRKTGTMQAESEYSIGVFENETVEVIR